MAGRLRLFCNVASTVRTITRFKCLRQSDLANSVLFCFAEPSVTVALSQVLTAMYTKNLPQMSHRIALFKLFDYREFLGV